MQAMSRILTAMYISGYLLLARPTHKRTEGRAPAWGSKFTIEAATLQGGSAGLAT
jgi:hypothetical protein